MFQIREWISSVGHCWSTASTGQHLLFANSEIVRCKSNNANHKAQPSPWRPLSTSRRLVHRRLPVASCRCKGLRLFHESTSDRTLHRDLELMVSTAWLLTACRRLYPRLGPRWRRVRAEKAHSQPPFIMAYQTRLELFCPSVTIAGPICD